ncbi:MAG TPA: hypothetical protein VLX44_19910 [Xanthobacteraceae bacterium]|nr:hypothetical protein [Xanthobacteraceae bacterium]
MNQTDPLFRAYKYAPGPERHPGRPIPLAFFIESTAPDNIDVDALAPSDVPELKRINPDDAINDIAGSLAEANDPTLVVAVHGFNTPRAAVLRRYQDSFDAVHGDPEISPHGLVCLGYRWPSEAIGSDRRSWLSAAPLLLRGLLAGGLAVAALLLVVLVALTYFIIHAHHWWAAIAALAAAILFLATSMLLAIPFASYVLRGAVYFRDTYRATQYGVPDLVEIIRQIDTRIMTITAERKLPERVVKLAFLGHSMGGYVVTSTIRILSDVFEPHSLRSSLNEGVVASRATKANDERDHLTFVIREGEEEAGGDIGNVFELTRLVLVSPDIPAEALISNRANFLEASLRRVREAYLFSNGEDEVLRQVSTLANSFSFPNRDWKYGFRLGNVEVVAKNETVTYRTDQPGPTGYLNDLRVGYHTLGKLYADLRLDKQNALPLVFSYFDCTDYVEGGRRILSLVDRGTGASNRLKTVSPFRHILLLLNYLRGQPPDVHGGYFDLDAATSKRLIYRLLCIGFDATTKTFAGITGMADACNRRGIEVLLSPYVGTGAPLPRTAAHPPAGLIARRVRRHP